MFIFKFNFVHNLSLVAAKCNKNFYPQPEVDKETDTSLYGGIAAIGNNSEGEIQYLDLDQLRDRWEHYANGQMLIILLD